MHIRTTTIPNSEEERIELYLHDGSPLPARIEGLIEEGKAPLVGYTARGGVCLDPADCLCFTVEGGRVWAQTGTGRYALRRRLYQVEALVGPRFLRINQSTLVAVGAIRRFEASLGGALRVTLANGFSDYVSRRCLRGVKERLGL